MSRCTLPLLLVLVLALFSTPARALETDFAFDQSLGMPFSEVKKDIPRDWKRIKSGDEFIKYRYRDFLITFRTSPAEGINAVFVETDRVPDKQTLARMEQAQVQKLARAGYRWNSDEGLYAKGSCRASVFTSEYRDSYIDRESYELHYE